MEIECRPGGFFDFGHSQDMVEMRMGVRDAGDMSAEFVDRFQNGRGIVTRINEDSLAGRFVNKQEAVDLERADGEMMNIHEYICVECRRVEQLVTSVNERRAENNGFSI